ncbi:MAG: NACHT domain-containing protein [Dysgonamonadaceae bacterium]|jgi:GTPase SAR1 family protein|nr:NACHT domain-containing protein [Dysgonamonadaceae bacterium]
MDFIRKQIDQRIDLLQAIDNKVDLKVHYQSRFEYVLVYLLAYLWNKNVSKLEDTTKEQVFQEIIKPSIGSIVKLCRILDVDKEVLKDSKLSKSIEKYPKLRNDYLGHGYSFEDSSDLISNLKELYDNVLTANLSALSANVDLIYVLTFDDHLYKGINYKCDGSTTPWSCPKDISDFEIKNLYGSIGINSYFRLSPFIEIVNYGKEIYFFNGIEEKLLGKVKYNRLLETGVINREWKELAEMNIVEDGIKIKTSNGTILNVYENNFKKYINVLEIKKKITDFLLKDKSSVCATLWGHGGVGKTATIQSICEDLANGERKQFDYIVFLSAKDRKYNYHTGNIEEIKDCISSFDELISGINKVIFNFDNYDTQHIADYKGVMLLVIDDFETFSTEEKTKIESFISLLNPNFHKIIITTRAANIRIGKEFQTNELSQEETKKFLLEVIENENFGSEEIIRRELENKENLQKIYEITNGRPLFIFQFAYVIGQKGFNDAIKFKIKEGDSAINFLYGRIYDYLSPKAKDLFVVLSLLVNNDDLVNVIEKAQYILNLEQESETFKSIVDELIKLRIIKFADADNRFFEIYSKEIFQMMSEYFQKRDHIFKGNCVSRRDQINKDKNLDIEHSLLLSANTNRVAKNEIEVIDNYKQIINRATSSLEVKLAAILNLAAYLVVDRGKKEDALKYLDDYSHYFDKNAKKGSSERKQYATFTKMWASYYWANGTKQQKEKAIDILFEYAKFGFDYNNDTDLELSGILLQYNSISVISDWLDLKEKSKYDEISDNEFRRIRDKQKQKCKDIHDKQGVFLFNNVSQKKLTDMVGGARQNIIAGLYAYIEVLMRLQKFDEILQICQYIYYCAPSNFHKQFKRKEEKIKQITRKNSTSYYQGKNKNITLSDSVSDFGERLQQALNKK